MTSGRLLLASLMLFSMSSGGDAQPVNRKTAPAVADQKNEVPPPRAEVIDGNTLRIGGTEVRLFGLDAPDREQTCGNPDETYFCGAEAALALRRMTDQHAIRCTERGRDEQGRALVVCVAGAEEINAALVRAGKAVADRTQGAAYAAAEAAAKREQRGLWAGTFQIPADWRREHARPPDALQTAATQAVLNEPIDAKDAKLSELSAQLDRRSTELAAATQQLEAERQAWGDLQAITQQTERARHTLETLQSQQAEATKALDATRQSLATLQQNVDQRSRSAREIENRAKTVQAALAATEQKLSMAQQELDARNGELKQIGEKVEEAHSQEAEMRTSIAQAAQILSDRTNELAALQSRRQAAQTSLDEAQRQFDALQAEQAQGEQAVRQLRTQIADLMQQRDALTADAETARDDVTAARSSLADLTRSIADRNQELAAVTTQIQQAHAQLAGLRDGISQQTPSITADQPQETEGTGQPSDADK
jgi:endonuclease YncB( thermonuclease family)/predicted  nucleic acid-binding Zn-ribbon protein